MRLSKICSALSITFLAACQAPVLNSATSTTSPHQPATSGLNGFQTQAVAPVAMSPLGANLGVVNDWSRTMPLVNLVKQARIFGSATAPWEALPNANYRQLPAGDFGVVLLAQGQGSRGIGGIYHFSFEGQARVRLVASRGSIQNLSYNTANNNTTGEINLADDSQNLMLSFTQTGSGIHNLKVLQPGYALDTQQVFTTTFLNHIRRFGTLRLADWSKVNGGWRPSVPNPDVSWGNRIQPSDTSFASLAGLPWEYLIQLANQTHQNIWINIPHMADDDYIRQLARLFRDQLDPSLKVYLEYSNEVWNWNYAQTQWNFDQAQREATSLNYDNTTNPGYLAWRRVARRIKEISAIFRYEYGNAGFNTRFFPVLAAQFGNPETLRQGLNYLNASFGPPENYLSATAGAPYFTHDRAADSGVLTADQIVAQLSSSGNSLQPGSNTGLGQAMERNITLSNYYNLPLMAYEGGPDTVGSNNLEAKRQALASPQMEQICVDYLQHWFSWGADTFLWYQAGATNRYTSSGSFGILENMSEPDTALNRCMDRVANSPKPALTAGFALPGSLDARLRVGRLDNWSSDRGLSSRSWPGTAEYLLRVPQNGHYQLRLTTSGGSRQLSQLPVWVNNRPMGTLTIPAGDNVQTQPLALDLPPGLKVLRLQFNGGTNNGYVVQSLNFEATPAN